MVQENAHHIHPDFLCPAQFTVDCGGVERFSLPKLQLVDGRAWREITPAQPAVLFRPFLCFFNRPPLCNRFFLRSIRP
jgi:hypothetical protein